MTAIIQGVLASIGGAAVTGQEAFTTAGTFTWVAPAGVTKVSVVAVGGGGTGNYLGCFCCVGQAFQGGGGGGLGYINNYTVVPGSSYTVVNGPVCGNSGDASFISTAVVKGGKGACGTSGGAGGNKVGDGGGNGGAGGYADACAYAGGGGAGGYAGNGGNGGCNYFCLGSASMVFVAPTAGSGGGGGGARSGIGGTSQAGGGGVGILGQGANGAAGVGPGSTAGFGGSGGQDGSTSSSGGVNCYQFKGNYGGGGGGNGSRGSRGAVRIIWPGCARSFPSTRTTDE
jgi:hypothetical protein